MLFALALLPYGQAACLSAADEIALMQLVGYNTTTYSGVKAIFESMCNRTDSAVILIANSTLNLQNYTDSYLFNASNQLKNQTDSIIGNKTEVLFANYTKNFEDKLDIASAIKSMADASNFTSKLGEVDTKISDKGQQIEDKLTEMINSRTAGLVNNVTMQAKYDELNYSAWIDAKAASMRPADYSGMWFAGFIVIVVLAFLYQVRRTENVKARIASLIEKDPKFAKLLLDKIEKQLVKEREPVEEAGFDLLTEEGRNRDEKIMQQHKTDPNIAGSLKVMAETKKLALDAAKRSKTIITKIKKEAASSGGGV